QPAGDVACGFKLPRMSQLARLLHLADSALPTGSFAYSYGLESSLTFGLVRTETELRAYLYSFLQQAVGFELPFITSAAAVPNADLGPLLLEYDAQLLAPALYHASLTQGKNWLKLLATFYPEAVLGELGRELTQQALPAHFVPLFGLSLGRVGFALADIQATYLHLALRDQLSAAIRLGFIGPMAGHLLQHDFYEVFENLLVEADIRPYTQATRCTVLLDVAQMLHDDIYSRLFQN
nr:urease accessory protein F [Tanacetum cinerariifolium]